MPNIKAPPLHLLAAELRVVPELAAYWLSKPWQRRLPKGDNHPVLVIPGFGANDISTAPLRSCLKRLGYAVYGWDQGTNLGMKTKVREGLTARLQEIHGTYEEKISLIGWSLGGVFAREFARHMPGMVRQVITLGSPINHSPDATNVDGLFRRFNPHFKPDLEGFMKRTVAPPVPCTAIYSKSDGVVHWRTSMENEAPNTRNIEVFTSHFGMTSNPLVLKAIAETLARPVTS